MNDQKSEKRLSNNPMLPSVYVGEDPSGLLLSEKFDGVRAVWDGEKLVSRNGLAFNAPGWFLSGLPRDVPLDGELWGGRGCFQKTAGVVRSGYGDWSCINFMVFDCIDAGPYTARLKRIQATDLPDHCRIVDQVPCGSTADFDRFECGVVSNGGEGVVLRDPAGFYEQGRTKTVLKYKRARDAEGTVLGYTEGRGRFFGAVGALVCEFNGLRFKLSAGLDDELRYHPPSIGTMVTFSFSDLTVRGIPRHPVFIGSRDYE